MYYNDYQNDYSIESNELKMKLNKTNYNSLDTTYAENNLVSQVNLKADNGISLTQTSSENTDNGVEVKTVTFSGNDVDQKFKLVEENTHSNIVLSQNGSEKPLNIKATGSVSVNTKDAGETLEINGVDTDTKFEHIWKDYYNETTTGGIIEFNSEEARRRDINIFLREDIDGKDYVDLYNDVRLPDNSIINFTPFSANVGDEFKIKASISMLTKILLR